MSTQYVAAADRLPNLYRCVPVRLVRPPKQLQHRMSKMISKIVTMICSATMDVDSCS